MNWIALATISALLSAAAAVTQKRILFKASALEFSFLVSLAVLALSAFVPFTQDVLAFDARTLALLAGKSVLGGIAFLLVMTGLERNPISHALPLLGLTPAVTGLLATFVLGEGLQGREWAGLAVMLAGTWALEAGPRGHVLKPFVELVTSGRHLPMFGAVLLFAIASVADKLLVGSMRVPPFVVMFHQHVVYALLYGALLVLRRHPVPVLMQRGREHLPLILAVAAFTIGYRYFQLAATQAGPVALVLAVKRTSILYATLVGGRLFAEERLATRVFAGALIVGAGFLFLGRE